ncbi:SDR family oxidoreductase [Arthrobacter sp. MYb213]|uniref:SDR family NAD(P)-dependent oxidoreductase n=1 Tax=Arthrobacter sp. MYb213 TaxID=1848595 RepID=UPI000CFDA470|nr:SDR family oxidoreductase [Arthrobacter sp. MYb213]PRB70288.1 hypothetical protein CQ011_09005 [Arthrobacter sp. MYb213]
MNIPNPAQPVQAREIEHHRLFSLEGKNYVVVGAGSGLGEHVARTIIALGGSVLGIDINDEPLTALAEELGMAYLVADATTEQGVEIVGKQAGERFGKLDGFVDVVGQMHHKDMSEYSLLAWEQDFKTNLGHAFLTGRVLAPMVDQGAIVYVSSLIAARGGRMAPGYAPAKAALEAWVKQLAQEHGPRGVRVNAVAPGLFLSPRMSSRQRSDSDEQILRSKPLLGRLGQPFEIAAAIVFLLSPAAGYITGSTLPVEGGALTREPSGVDELYGLEGASRVGDYS